MKDFLPAAKSKMTAEGQTKRLRSRLETCLPEFGWEIAQHTPLKVRRRTR
jgi:hypothetical protein